MIEFFRALAEFEFLRHALLAGVLASVASGVVGTYVVTRRITVIAGSLAHSVLGGMGVAYWAATVHGIGWLQPLHGALVAAVIAAFVIGTVRLRGAEREDTAISALWALGMATGILFLAQTPGYKADLMTYLFGNVVLVDTSELRLLLIVDVLVVAVAVLFHQPLLAICFDEEFARARGLRVGFFYYLLLLLVALTVVTLVYVVGIVLVIALLTLPVAIAGRFARKLWQMMAVAAVLSAVITTTGLAVSYAPDLPVGATTILLAGGLYLLVTALGLRRRTRRVPDESPGGET
ncbi:MAG TPA: metal ABC transporter permease [Candidatus Krumholzibacteria bacterium]|nr:metal ABC transporter permease [Candidatus Krumholzibacteria bacterium]